VAPENPGRAAARRRPQRLLGRDDEVDAEVVLGLRQLLVEQLERVDGGRDRGRVADEPGLDEEAELEVGVAAALPDADALAVRGDGAADDEVDGLELLDRDGLRAARLDRRVPGEAEERLRLPQPRNRHVDDLALGERPPARRQLRRIRVALEHARLTPLRALREPPRRQLGADEVRNPPARPGKPRRALPLERRPNPLANLLLRRLRIFRHAGLTPGHARIGRYFRPLSRPFFRLPSRSCDESGTLV
jgi:hypothetical protein